MHVSALQCWERLIKYRQNIKFDCLPGPNLETDHKQTWKINSVDKIYKCAKLHRKQSRIVAPPPPTTVLKYKTDVHFSVCITQRFFFLPKVHSPNHSTDSNAYWLRRRALGLEIALGASKCFSEFSLLWGNFSCETSKVSLPVRTSQQNQNSRQSFIQ